MEGVEHHSVSPVLTDAGKGETAPAQVIFAVKRVLERNLRSGRRERIAQHVSGAVGVLSHLWSKGEAEDVDTTPGKSTQDHCKPLNLSGRLPCIDVTRTPYEFLLEPEPSRTLDQKVGVNRGAMAADADSRYQ
jgi:hypothetical protein